MNGPAAALRRAFARWYRGIRRHPNPWARRAIGALLVVGGLLGFLPVLGFWMLPLGLILLSDDAPWLRRLRRRAFLALNRRWRAYRDRSAR